MKQFLIFIGGMVAGALLFYAIGFRTENSVKEKIKQQLIEKLSEIDSKVEIQYIEIKGKKGNVIIHTGMPKDSVQILVGKPDKVSLNTIGGSAYENWGYKISNKHGIPKEFQLADLELEFVNGRLKNVQQD